VAASRHAADPTDAFIASLDRRAERSTLYGRLGPDSAGLLDDAEVRSVIRLLWLAATMTTERAITRSVLRLLQHPDVRERVETDPALVGPFVEEVLRLHPPEHMVSRRTTRAVEVGGVTVPSGAPVQLCISAANRDPARFDEPASLRLDRTPKGHLTFGGGIHRCIGAPLARSVIAVAVRTLLQGAPGFRAREPLATIPHFATMTALAPERLVIGS